jgi:hypothetical protein
LGYLIGGIEYEVYKENFFLSYIDIFNYFRASENPIFTIARPLFVKLFQDIDSVEDNSILLFGTIKAYFDDVFLLINRSDNLSESWPDASALRNHITAIFVSANFLASHYVDFCEGVIPYLRELRKVCTYLNLISHTRQTIQSRELSMKKLKAFFMDVGRFKSERDQYKKFGCSKQTLAMFQEVRGLYTGQKGHIAGADIYRLVSVIDAENELVVERFREDFCKEVAIFSEFYDNYESLCDSISSGKIIDDTCIIGRPQELLKPFLGPPDTAPNFAASVALISTLSFQNKRLIDRGGMRPSPP